MTVAMTVKKADTSCVARPGVRERCAALSAPGAGVVVAAAPLDVAAWAAPTPDTAAPNAGFCGVQARTRSQDRCIAKHKIRFDTSCSEEKSRNCCGHLLDDCLLHCCFCGLASHCSCCSRIFDQDFDFILDSSTAGRDLSHDHVRRRDVAGELRHSILEVSLTEKTIASDERRP